jgi:nucleotide-binding universal stress UspA family protein
MEDKLSRDGEAPVVRRMLIAVDQSPESAYAAEYGLGLARALSAEVMFASVIDAVGTAGELTPEIFSAVPDPVEEQIEATMPDTAEETLQRGLLNAWLEAAKVHGVVASAALSYGSPVPELLGMATAQHVDLIVCGTHGRHGIQRAILGSVAENLARHAPCAVLLLRRHP